jgi:phage replication-related protein YjqB (UPF0714/DUF867 family)
MAKSWRIEKSARRKWNIENRGEKQRKLSNEISRRGRRKLIANESGIGESAVAVEEMVMVKTVSQKKMAVGENNARRKESEELS